MNQQTLFDRLCSLKHLYAAWEKLNKTNRGSFGLSGESIDEFDEQLDVNLESLSQQLKTGKYQFSAARPYLIPKPNGKLRPLQIPEIGDRVVLKAMALLLEQELRTILLPGEGVSFAYEKGKGIQNALSRIKEHYDQGNRFIYEADIVDFFGTVSRDKIVEQISEQLPDNSLNELIRQGITPRVGGLQSIVIEYHELFADKGGIPQGNPLSPLFSNVYLSPFDAMMTKRGFKLVRYADDFVVPAPSEEAAKAAYECSQTYLKDTLRLDIHPLSAEPGSKTRIVDPTKETFSFLSVSFDGKNLFPSVKGKDKFIDSLLQLCSDTSEPNVAKLLTKMKNKHDGWISSYLFTDVQRYFEELDAMINWGLYKYLKNSGWPLSRSSLGKIPKRFRKRGEVEYKSGECLSDEQRKSSGIPLSKALYAQRMEKKEKKAKKQGKPDKPAKQKVAA